MTPCIVVQTTKFSDERAERYYSGTIGRSETSMATYLTTRRHIWCTTVSVTIKEGKHRGRTARTLRKLQTDNEGKTAGVNVTEVWKMQWQNNTFLFRQRKSIIIQTKKNNTGHTISTFTKGLCLLFPYSSEIIGMAESKKIWWAEYTDHLGKGKMHVKL